MIKRRKTRQIRVGALKIGSRHPIAVQSMTKVPTTDVARCVRQVNRLSEAGCSLVRIAVPRRADTEAFARIVDRVNIPLVADIHFSADRAVEAMEAGAAKIRLNPGNMRKTADIMRVIDAAKQHKTAIRIGVNEASIRDLKGQPVPFNRRIALMLKEIRQYIRLFDKRGFDQLVLSSKSTDTYRTIEINRRIAEAFDFPLHVGLTHAGLPDDAKLPSAVALGALFSQGIGDTVRVSVAGDPVVETRIACDILTSLGLRPRTAPELIVCPTCGRTEINVIKLAKRVKKGLAHVTHPVRIAVMGCVVNGPGEAEDADLAICAGKGKAFLYRDGQKIAVVPEDQLMNTLLEEIDKLSPES